MSNCILEREKQVEGLLLKYAVVKRETIVDDNIVTSFDIEVQKYIGNTFETDVCHNVTSSLDTAKLILDILYRNEVLPETLLEVIEECLEIV